VDAAIQMLLDEKGVSQNELAMRMGVSRAALRKWCTQRMTLRHLVAICIALDLRADIGEELVRLAGIRKSNTVEYNLLYHMLFETKDLTVEAANLIMDKEKLPRLTQGQDEAMAG
jgi:transcriptional regulator with XRE-family HTH domain